MTNKVKDIRKSKGITQYKLGKILNLSQPKVSDIERGKRKLKLDEAVNIAIFLNVKVEDLVTKQS